MNGEHQKGGMSAHYFCNRKMLIKGFNNAARQQYERRISVRPLSPFISFRFPLAADCELFSLSGVQGEEKLPLLTYKTNVCPKVAQRAERDVICARAPATQSSEGFIGGRAPRLKEEKTRKRKRKRAIGLTSGSPQAEKKSLRVNSAAHGMDVMCGEKGSDAGELGSRNQHRTHSAKTPAQCDGSDTVKSL